MSGHQVPIQKNQRILMHQVIFGAFYQDMT